MSSANYRGRGFAPRGFRPRGPPGPRFPPPNFTSNRGRNVDTSHGWNDNHPQPWQPANRPQGNHFEQKPWRGGPPNSWRGHDNQNRGGRNRGVNGRSRGNMPTSFGPQNGPARGFGSGRGPRPGIRGGPRLGHAVRRVSGYKFGFSPPRQSAPPISDSLAVPALGSEEERQQKIAATAYNLKQKLSTSTGNDPSHYWEQNFQEMDNSLVAQPGTSNHAIPEQQLHSPMLDLTSNNLQHTELVDPVPELTRVINEGESYCNEENETAAAATNTAEPFSESSDFNKSTSQKDPVGENSTQSTTPNISEEKELYLPRVFDPRGPQTIQNIIEHRLEQSHPTPAYYPHHMTSLNTPLPNHTSFIPTLPFNSSASSMPYQKQNELQPLPMAFNSQYQATGCHSSNLVSVLPPDNRMISSGAIHSTHIELSPNTDLSNSLQPTGFAPSLGTTYNSSIRLPTAVPCIVRDLTPLPLMPTSSPSMLEPLPMPAGIFNIPVISSVTNQDSSVPLQKASSPNMDDELDDMQAALKFAKTQLNMKCEQNDLSSGSTFMPFKLVSSASSQQLLSLSPESKLTISAPPTPASNKNETLKPDSRTAMVELQKRRAENTTGVLSIQKVFSPNSPVDKVPMNPMEIRSSVDNPPQVKSSTDAVTQNFLSTFIRVRQVDNINSPTVIDRPAKCTDICKQPESVGSDVIVNGYKRTCREKNNEERPKRQQLEQAVVKKSQNLVTSSANKKHVLHLEAHSIPAAGSSRKAKSSTPSDVNWKEKVISRFLKMSKNDIYNMVNSSGLRKFDVAMQHLVKEKKNSLSRERRSSADDKVKSCDMLREEFMSELGAMLDPSAVVDIENLPATFLQHLSEVLKLNDEPSLADDMENSVKSRLTDDENARQGNSHLQEDIDDIDKSTNKNTLVDWCTSSQPHDVSNVNTTVTRESQAIVELPERTKAANRAETNCQRSIGERSLDVKKMQQALPSESSAKDSDRIVNSRKSTDPDPPTTVKECTLDLDSELFVDPKRADLTTRIERRNPSISRLTVTNSIVKSTRPVTEESIYARLKKVERWNRQHCISIDSYRNLTKEEWEEKYGKAINNLTDKESISTHTCSMSSSRETSHDRFSPSPKSTVISESSDSKRLNHINKVCYVDEAAKTEPMQVFNNVNREDNVCSDFQNPTSESMSSGASNSSRKWQRRHKKKRKHRDSKKKKRETSKRRKKNLTTNDRPNSKEKLLAPNEIKIELPVKIENIKEEFPCPDELKRIEPLTNVDQSKTTTTTVVDRSKKLALVGQSTKDETLPALKKSIQTVRKSYPLEIASTSAANTELCKTRAITCEPTQIDQTNISSKEDTTVETNCFQSVALENKEILPNSMEIASQEIYGVAKSPSRLTVPPEDKRKSKQWKFAPSVSESEVKKLPDAIEPTSTQDKDLNKPEKNTSNDDAKYSNTEPTFVVEYGAERPADETIDVPSEQPRKSLAIEPKLAGCFVVPNSVETQSAQLTKSRSKKIGIETYKARVLQRITGKIGKTSTTESRVRVSIENTKNTPHDYKEISHANEAVDHVEPKRAAHTEQNAAVVQINDVEARVHVKKSKTVTHTNEAKLAGHEKQTMATVHKNEPETAVREEQQKTVVHEENSKATVREKNPKTAGHTNEAETVIHKHKSKVAVHANETKSTVHPNQPKITVHAHHHYPHGSKSDSKKVQVGNNSITHHTQKHSSSSNLKSGAKNKSGDKCVTKDTLLKSETHEATPLKPAKISKKKHSLQGNAGTPEHGTSKDSPSHKTVAPFTEHGKLSSKSSIQNSSNLTCNSKKHSNKREVLNKKFGKKHSNQEKNSKEKLSTEQSSTIDVSVHAHRSWPKPGPLSFKKSSILQKQESHRLSKIQSKIKENLKSGDIKTKIGINLNPVVRLVKIVLPCRKSERVVASESEKTLVNIDNTLPEIKTSRDFDGIQAAERSDGQETERLKNNSEIEVTVNSSKQDELISTDTPDAEEPATTTMESETLSVPSDVDKQNTVDETTAETVNCAEKVDEMSGTANNYDSILPGLTCISPTASCNQQEVIETLIELPAEVELDQEYYDSKYPSTMQYSEMDVVHVEISDENLVNFDAVDMTPLPTEVIADIQLSELEDNESIDIDIVEATGESTEFLLDSEIQTNSDQQCAIEIDKFSLPLQPSNELGYAGICRADPWITSILHDLIDEVSNRWNASASTEHATDIEVTSEPVASNNTEISSVDTDNQSLKNEALSPEITNNTDQNDNESSVTTFELQIDAQSSENAAPFEESAIGDYAISDKSSNNDSLVVNNLVISDEVTDGNLDDTKDTAGSESSVDSTSPLKGFPDECIQSSLINKHLLVESIKVSFDNSIDDISEEKYENLKENELSSETKNNFLKSMTTSEVVSVTTENLLTNDTEQISTDICSRIDEAIDKSDSTNEVDVPYEETACNEPPEKQSDNIEECESLDAIQPNVQEDSDWLQFTTESKTLIRMEKETNGGKINDVAEDEVRMGKKTNDGKINDVAEDECNQSDVDTDDSLDFENGEFIVVSEVPSDEEGSIDKESARYDESATTKSFIERITNRVIQSIKYSSTSDVNDSIDETSSPKASLFDPIHKSSGDSNSHDTTDTADLQGDKISKIVPTTESCTASINVETSTSTSFDDTVTNVIPRDEVPATNVNSAPAVENTCIFDIWINEFDARNSKVVNIATESPEENTLNLVDRIMDEKTTSSNDHEEVKKLPSENMPPEPEPADGVPEVREAAKAQLGEETSFVEVNEPCNDNTSDTQNQSIIDECADNDIDSIDTELQTATDDDLKGHESPINRSLKGKTLYVKWDKTSVAANIKRSKSAGKSRFSSTNGKTDDRLYKSERKIKHKKHNKLKLAGAKVDEAMKSQEVVTTVKSQDVAKSMRKPTTKQAVMARMIEIDVEIHTLMSEKMKLYEMLESESFTDAESPPVIDDAEVSGNVQTQTTPRCKTPVAIMTEIMNHLEFDHTATGDARSTIMSKEESAGESTKKSSCMKLRKLHSLRRKIRKRDKNKKSSAKIEGRKVNRVESKKLKDPVKNKQGSGEMNAKPILKKANPVDKSAEDKSRSTVNWQSDIDDSVNNRPFMAAKKARDKKISRILVSNKNKKRKHPFPNNCKKLLHPVQLKAKPVLKCTLTNEEEEMPLAELYNEILQRQSNSVGGTPDHLSEIINAVAENTINEYGGASSVEPRKESDTVRNVSPNVSLPDSSLSKEPATTGNEKVDEYKKCENHNQMQYNAESRISLANANSPVAEDNLPYLQTFDDIGGDLPFGNRNMIGSTQNNDYNTSHTAESVTERKSQNNSNDETRIMSVTEIRESLKSDVLPESVIDTRPVRQHSFTYTPSISDSTTHSHCGLINLEIIEAGINAFDSILGKIEHSDKVENNISTAISINQIGSIEDTRSKEDNASADREVMNAFDQIEDLRGESALGRCSTFDEVVVPILASTECSIQPKYSTNVDGDVRQQKIEDADRNWERSHLRRSSAKNAREAITQQSAPMRAVKSKERSPNIPASLNRLNESTDTEDSRRRGKKRKMTTIEMANCKVRLIDCKYTYLKSRAFRRSSERSQLSRNDPATGRSSEKAFVEYVESNVDSNVQITKANINEFLQKNTNSANRRGESLLPLAMENVNISETTSKPEIRDDTVERSIEAETADDRESSYPPKLSLLKGYKADDANASQINPNPRALRSFNKSKKARIQATRSTSSTPKLTNPSRGKLDQSKEITNCQPMIASEYLDDRMAQTTANTEVDIPKVPTSNTEVEIVNEFAMPRNNEMEKSNNISLRCSGSADVIEVETTRIQYTAHKGPILDIKVFHDSFLAASEDGTIYRYSQKSDEVLNTYQGHKSAVTCMCIVKIATSVPKTELLFSGSLDASLRCFDIKSGQEVRNMSYVGSAVQCMDHAWGMIFLGTKTGFVYRFNVKNNSFKGEPIPFSKESVLALKATTEGPRRVLIAASRHQPITIRDAYDGLLVRTVSGHRTHTVYSLMMHNNLVYCGTSSTAIPVFDFINGSQVTLYNAGMGIVCIQMYQELLFAGCYDGNIYVFDTKEQKIVCSIPGPGNMLLSMGIVQNKLIAGSKDRRLHIWQIPKQVQTLLWRKT